MTIYINDLSRQWLNLIAAPAMWIVSTLPQMTNWGRSAKEFSDANDSLLVPFGAAFSIWFPIFVGCIGYAVLQGLKTNRTREIFRKAGWWTGAGFTGVCLWAVFSGWGTAAIARWGTALIFIPTMLCLVKAMLIFTRANGTLDKTERLWVWLPLSLIAGWTSIACFLNWTPIITDNLSAFVSPVTANLGMLSAALFWAVFVTRRSSGNMAYAFPIIWGLGWLAFKAMTQAQTPEVIGFGAVAGLVIISGAVFISKNRRKKTLMRRRV